MDKLRPGCVTVLLTVTLFLNSELTGAVTEAVENVGAGDEIAVVDTEGQVVGCDSGFRRG